jgi:hypothetical protein
MPELNKTLLIIIVQADALDLVSAVLHQKYDAFYQSCMPEKAAAKGKNYSVIKSLALIYIIRKCQNYIYGTRFIPVYGIHTAM